ncbi:MAG TPA: hemerythrin family protein [Rhodospirillaceae bacterium]|nr:hemerythrin family protein [Rhodospirillaceae bacterium]
MDDLVWNDSLSVGDQTLDGHHKRLFSLCSELERGISLDTAAAVIPGVLKELQHYISYHFSEEESLMEKINFPFLDDHRDSHRVIAQCVDDMSANISINSDYLAAGDLAEFLRGWLLHHIEIEDFAYRRFL